jgi:hypothetical protein
MRWTYRWRRDGRTFDTAEAGFRALADQEGGAAERALATAEAAAQALARLVEVLETQSALTPGEVNHVLGLHAFEPVDAE